MKITLFVVMLTVLIGCRTEESKYPSTSEPVKNESTAEEIIYTPYNPIEIHLFDVYGSSARMGNKSGYLFLTDEGKPVRSLRTSKYRDTLNTFFNNQIRLIDCCDSNEVIHTENKSIIFILDVSDSMRDIAIDNSGQLLEVLKDRIINFIRKYPTNEYAIIEFCITANIKTPQYSNDTSYLFNVIRSLRIQGGTNYKPSLDLVKTFITNNNKERHSIYFLSDGGDQSKTTNYINYFKRFKKDKISFFSLIFNGKFDGVDPSSAGFSALSDSLRSFYRDSLNGWFLNGIYPHKLSDALEVTRLINEGYIPCKVFWDDPELNFKDSHQNDRQEISKHVNFSLFRKSYHNDIEDIYFPSVYDKNYHFFTTGYYYPSTDEVLDKLDELFSLGTARNDYNSYIANPLADRDPITNQLINYRAHSSKIKVDLTHAYNKIMYFKTRFDSIGNPLNKIRITVYGYTDPRTIFPGAKYNDDNEVLYKSFRIKKNDTFDNEKLAFLRAYFTYYMIVTQDFGLENFNTNLTEYDEFFQNSENFDLVIKSMGNDSKHKTFAFKRRASISIQLIKNDDCSCYLQSK